MENRSCKNINSGTYSRRQFLQTAALSAVAPFSVSDFPKANKSPDKSEHLFWGDLHTHTKLSDGNGSPEENFEIAKSHLDFWAMADHAYDEVIFARNPRKTARGEKFLNDHWERVQQLCRTYEKNGQFIPFLAYEWTNFTYGHHNIYYLNYDQPIRMPSHWIWADDG